MTTFEVNDRVEDSESDRATVREVDEAGEIVAVEWDCCTGVTVRPHPSFIHGAFQHIEGEA